MEIWSGPVRVHSDGDNLFCIVANVANANINNVNVAIRFRKSDGTTNGSVTWPCGTLTPDETCQAIGIGGPSNYAAFCQVTYPTGGIGHAV